jgi:hypothetical protein
MQNFPQHQEMLVASKIIQVPKNKFWEKDFWQTKLNARQR